jgi:hypothetical protein
MVPGTLKAVLWELDQLARPGANGCGCCAIINADIVAAARVFVRALLKAVPHRPQVVPTASGKLQLVWYCGLETLELEFESTQTIYFWKSCGDLGIADEATFPAADVEYAVALVEGFRNGTCRTALPETEAALTRRWAVQPG